MKPMKYFIDTEFIEEPNTIQLISIVIVADDGRQYFALSSEYDSAKASVWVTKNVIIPLYNEMVGNSSYYNHLNFHQDYGKQIRTIRKEILEFVGFPEYPKGKPEFWGYYANYDWVVFCWIFGRMVDLPKGFPMYCRDIKQVMDMLSLTKKDLNIHDPNGKHDALVDAAWNRELYYRIINKLKQKRKAQ